VDRQLWERHGALEPFLLEKLTLNQLVDQRPDAKPVRAAAREDRFNHRPIGEARSGASGNAFPLEWLAAFRVPCVVSTRTPFPRSCVWRNGQHFRP
jgi:hypothetical protein